MIRLNSPESKPPGPAGGCCAGIGFCLSRFCWLPDCWLAWLLGGPPPCCGRGGAWFTEVSGPLLPNNPDKNPPS